MARRLRRVRESLKVAAEGGDIEGLYESIKEDPTVLDRIDAIPFVETPLHTAASAGQASFALEILRLKPSFGPKLNPDGLSSLHLALINRKFDIAQELINLDTQLIRVKGKEGETPLHFIVKKEQIDHVHADQRPLVEGSPYAAQQQREDPRILILAEFLFACPNSIEDRTIHGETALHIAVKTKNKRAVEILLGCIDRINKRWMLTAKDYQGNKALHMAVKNAHVEMVDLLVQKFSSKEINRKNSATNETALDVALLLGTDEAELIVKILRNAGAKKSSPFAANDYSLATFFSSPLRLSELLCKLYNKHPLFIRRRRMPMLSTLEGMVVLLITIAILPGALTRLGGAGGDIIDQVFRNGSYVSSPNHQSATTPNFINATFLIPTDLHGESTYLFQFYVSNTIAFYLLILMAIFILPWRLFRGRTSMSAVLCDLVSMVPILIAILTFPAALNYPFRGAGDDIFRNGSHVSTNVSSTNPSFIDDATFFIPTDVHGGSTYSFQFYLSNTVALFLSMLMIIFFLLYCLFRGRRVRNLVLVVAVLLLIASAMFFQAALSPPGGVDRGSTDQVLTDGSYFNFSNATIFIPTEVDGESTYLFQFNVSNTVAFFLSMLKQIFFPANRLFRGRRRSMSTELRNLVTLVGLLITSGMLQAQLSPDQVLPYGDYVSTNVWSFKQQQFAGDTSFSNATTFIPTDVHGENDSWYGTFVPWNAIAFALLVMAMMLLSDGYLPVLRFALFALVFCSDFSTFPASATYGFSWLDNLRHWLQYVPMAYSAMALWNLIFGFMEEVPLPTDLSPFLSLEQKHLRMLRKLLRNYHGQ